MHNNDLPEGRFPNRMSVETKKTNLRNYLTTLAKTKSNSTFNLIKLNTDGHDTTLKPKFRETPSRNRIQPLVRATEIYSLL